VTDIPPVVKETLIALHQAVREDFTRNRRVMSFGEYLAVVFAEPLRQCSPSRCASYGRRPSTSSIASITTVRPR
jgi:hypothetical protein